MSQEKPPVHLSVMYLLTVFVCLAIIHLSEVVSSYFNHHQEETAQAINQKLIPFTSKEKKPDPPKSKKVILQEDSLSFSLKKDTTLSDDSVQKPTVNHQDFFRQLTSEYKKEVLNSHKTRTDIVIRYYKKEKDHNEVYKLRQLGFYIHERPADRIFDEFASNAIYYGDSVRKRDIILIAHHLIKRGMKIQNISLSKFHDTWKAHSIEIGTDTTAFGQAHITLADLRKKWEDM